MNREQKESVVAEIKDMFNRCHASFLVECKGISVGDLQALRKKLRSDRAVFKVAKARLMKIAATDVPSMDGFKEKFKNQVGLVFAMDDVTSVAKQVVEFSKEHEAMNVVAGFFESKVMSKDQVNWLASIPSREVLLAQLVGTLQSPLANLLHCLEVLKEQKASKEATASENMGRSEV